MEKDVGDDAEQTRNNGWPDRGPGTALLVTIALAFGCLVLQCCAGCPLGILEGALAETMGLEQGTLVTHPISLAFISVFSLGTVLLLGAWSARIPVRELIPLGGFRPLLIVALVPAVFGSCVALMEVATLIEWLLPMPAMMREFFEGAFGGRHTTLGSFVLAVIVAPFMEEAVFRGLLLRSMLRRWPALPAVLITSLLFALFHANPWQFVGPLILGLLFGWLTVRTGTLWPAILAHALNNAIALTTMQLLGTDTEAQVAAEHSPQLGPLWLDLCGLACLVVGLALCVHLLRHQRPRSIRDDGAPRP